MIWANPPRRTPRCIIIKQIMLLHGILPPVTTPFYPDGQVYYKKIEHNIERYSRTPIAGIVVQGSTGEAILLSDQERRDVLKAVREAAAPEKVLVAATGIESAIETLRLTEYAATLGYDVALVRTPHFYKSQMAKPINMLTFFRTVADRSPLPVLLYNVPAFTGYDLPAELVAELAQHPNIIGIKESGGDVEKIRKMAELTRSIQRLTTVTETFTAVTQRMITAAQTQKGDGGALVTIGGAHGADSLRPSSSAVQVVGHLKTRQKEVGFQVLSGTADKLKPSLEAGAVGAILGFACPAPTACFEIYTAWKEGDEKLSTIQQDRIIAAARKVVTESGPAGIKYAMDLNGYYGGHPRLPLLPLTATVKSEIETLLANIRN
jgi:dihydrodipicolinate synthase/N-acetylneuraminate lyase